MKVFVYEKTKQPCKCLKIIKNVYEVQEYNKVLQIRSTTEGTSVFSCKYVKTRIYQN